MKLLIYLHGLGSCGDTPKTQALREAMQPLGVKVVAPDLPVDPAEVLGIISDLVAEHLDDLEKVVFMGTSLGGFYSIYAGETFDAPYLVVNPALTPSVSLAKYLITPTKSWVNGEDLPITNETIINFARLENALPKHATGVLGKAFLARDDDVIPIGPALQFFKHARYTVTETGGHRFEEEWPRVIEAVKQLF